MYHICRDGNNEFIEALKPALLYHASKAALQLLHYSTPWHRYENIFTGFFLYHSATLGCSITAL